MSLEEQMKLLKCFKAPTLKQILLIGILKRLTAFKVVFYFIVFFFFFKLFYDIIATIWNRPFRSMADNL